jgi:aryl-alcohol dehydrogenase-like predicted oxidoreductase
MKIKPENITRRKFVQQTAAVSAATLAMPYLNFGQQAPSELMKRPFGRIPFEVTTLGLGGQASLQWTPDDVDPVAIILKAYSLGVNYYDTSNLYGPSQMNYGKAFRQLGLVPGQSNYDEGKRKSIFLTSKTALRWGKGEDPNIPTNKWTNGDVALGPVGDIKRTLTQVFGDGKGNYPKGAYIDMILMHTVNNMNDVNAIYTGYDKVSPTDENIGTLVTLIDYRDGTNFTGLNPNNEKLIRHIGFSGHYSPVVLSEMILRDSKDQLDAILIAINANDRIYHNMQHNVIPIAAAKNMGIIGMKVFADGAMYTKPSHWTQGPHEVVRSVGDENLDSKKLIQYSLTTPGVSTLIIGIGQISDDPEKCQLTQNIKHSQVNYTDLTETDRLSIEAMALRAKEGKTNYFQDDEAKMVYVREPEISQKVDDGKRKVSIKWHTAFSKSEPIKQYEIMRDGEVLKTFPHKTQTGLDAIDFFDFPKKKTALKYKVVAIDTKGNKLESKELILESV